MKEVKVKVDEVLKIVQMNRMKHLEIYNKAIDGHRQHYILWLKDQLNKASFGEPYDTYFSLSKPDNHVGDYDRVIKMLELSVDKEIILSSSEVDKYIMDQWQWTNDFIVSGSGCILPA